MRKEELAALIGAPALPAAPDGIFERAMKRYENGECPLFSPDFYTELHNKYGCFPHYLDAFREAAAAVGRCEALARYACYLEEALRDRENSGLLCKPFFYPVSPSGEADIVYDMVTALPVAAMIPYAAEQMAKRNITGKILNDSLLFADSGVHEYARRNGGRPAFRLFEWFQLSIDARLFRIGRLEVELGSASHSHTVVYRGNNGSFAVLADNDIVHRSGRRLGTVGCPDTDTEGSFEARVTEDEYGYTGHPVNDDGLILSDIVTLPKAEYSPVLNYGDTVIDLHIPPGDDFSPGQIDVTLEQIRSFLSEHFPEINYRCFMCSSWMLDPQLGTLLRPGSNIVSFQRRFRKLPCKSGGQAVFYFVFSVNRGTAPVLDELPEMTSMQRTFKEWYRTGHYIYETSGFFF